MKEVSLPCPECQTKISFDLNGLLQGKKYTCPNCNSSIGLGDESKSSVEEAIKKFEELKKKNSSDPE